MSGAHASLSRGPCALIGGRVVDIPGSAIVSHDPARPERVIWSGTPRLAHVDEAVDAARGALPAWARWSFERRAEALRAFQRVCKAREQAIADLLCDEVGKPMWEARQEAALLASKVDITLDRAPGAALHRVLPLEVPVSETRVGRCFFKPHGVMAVLGPFNFPAHLPNGHIVPALACGNTIVFKPSDKAPATGHLLGELLLEALESVGAPAGVVNVIQGAADVASGLSRHAGVDGVLFTGSWPVGRRILEANLDTPGRIVALEMGGNNPAVVMDDADLRQAVSECARSGFATAGQRCTCTRRVIVHEKVADRFIKGLVSAAEALAVGDPRSEKPVFMGPVIRKEAQEAVAAFVGSLERAGGEVLLRPATPGVPGCKGGHFVTPGIVRVDRFSLGEDAGRDAGCDVEVFGPVVRVCVVKSLDQAIRQANASRYGLAAAIFTKDPAAAERFVLECRAGCVNVNNGTAGASSKLPFGGLGLSGNHRPAGAFSVDYCAYPVASMVESSAAAALSPGMTFEDAWLG